MRSPFVRPLDARPHCLAPADGDRPDPRSAGSLRYWWWSHIVSHPEARLVDPATGRTNAAQGRSYMGAADGSPYRDDISNGHGDGADVARRTRDRRIAACR